MNIYFLNYNPGISKYTNNREVGAWPKLFSDLKEIYGSINVHHLYLYLNNEESNVANVLKQKARMALSALKEDDLLILPSPFFFTSTKFTEAIIDEAKNFFNARVACLTVDIASFRVSDADLRVNKYKKAVQKQRQDEKRILNMFDGLITQTNEMAVAIQDNMDYKGKIIVQGPWGYVTDKYNELKTKQDVLVFAGNPSKALYLNELNQDASIEYNIYGQIDKESPLEGKEFNTDWAKNDVSNFHYKGSYDFPIIDKMLEGNFGLIWDSTSYPKVTGGRGQYMRLAMPHKFSMYAVAGMPVIVWKKSSLAKIVQEKNIGWIIDDLTEIPDLIHSITDEEYREKVDNLSVYSELIRSGFFQKRAIFDLMGALYYGEEHEIKSDYRMKLGYGD